MVLSGETLLDGAGAVVALGAEGPEGAECAITISHSASTYGRYKELTIIKVHGYWMFAILTDLSIIEISADDPRDYPLGTYTLKFTILKNT